MRLRQSPMIEACSLMATSFLFFMAGIWLIEGDVNKMLAKGPTISAMLLFPAFVLWLIFGRVARDAKISTRLLTSVGVALAVAAFGALLLQTSLASDNKAQGVLVIAQIVIAFTISCLLGSAITFGLLVRESKVPDATLITKPIVQARKKKRK